MEPSTPTDQRNKRPRIVVLGGGFAGAYCAQHLLKELRAEDPDILVLDRNNYFIFYPLLVEAGIGNLEPRHAVVPIRHFLARRARFRMADVVGVDPDAQRVTYRMAGSEEERVAAYDHLVVAMGSMTALPPVPGLRDHGRQMKTLADSVGLRDRVIQQMELANAEPSATRRRAMLHLVVVGGNFTGIEVAGEFNHYMRDATRAYRNLDPEDVRVTLVEVAERILPALNPSLARYATAKMREDGVRIICGDAVSGVSAEGAELASGTFLAAETVVWCAGIAANPATAAMPFEKDGRGYLLAERDFRIKGRDNVWGIGDCAVNLDPQGRPYPATAQNATRMGVAAARNIARALRGQPTRNFSFKPLGSLAGIGKYRAVAEIMGVRLSGFPAWWLWRTVYLAKMPGLSRKVRVALDWTLELFFQHDIVQLGVHHPPKTGASPKDSV